MMPCSEGQASHHVTLGAESSMLPQKTPQATRQPRLAQLPLPAAYFER